MLLSIFDPTAEELANIALLTARAVKFFGLKPSVAMLSYSNFGSAVSESSLKVREAVAYLHKHHPDLVVDGEIQADLLSILRRLLRTIRSLNSTRAKGLMYSSSLISKRQTLVTSFSRKPNT